VYGGICSSEGGPLEVAPLKRLQGGVTRPNGVIGTRVTGRIGTGLTGCVAVQDSVPFPVVVYVRKNVYTRVL